MTFRRTKKELENIVLIQGIFVNLLSAAFSEILIWSQFLVVLYHGAENGIKFLIESLICDSGWFLCLQQTPKALNPLESTIWTGK